MGEARKDALRLGFDRAIKLEFHGTRVSSDAGLFPYRDLDDAARLAELVAADLFDFRTGNNICHSMTALLRRSVYSRLAGYEDVNDAERLSHDPVMRYVVGERATEKQAASTSQVSRFETEVLTHPHNLAGLDDHARSVGGPDPTTPPDQEAYPRHGQFGQRDLRQAGRHGVQRSLRLRILPPAVRLQSGRRCRVG